MTLGHNIGTYNVLCGAALLILVGMAAADYLLPLPKPKNVKDRYERELKELNGEILASRQQFTTAKTALEKRIWKGEEDQASPEILADLNDLAVAGGVRIVSFRPQKAQVNRSLRQLGFVMVAEGSFGQVMSMVRQMEGTMTRTAIHQIQIASSDGGSDRVTATIGLAAYVEDPAASKPTAPARRVAAR
jgi:Tfp pilus assembly protein PilO